MPSRRTPPPGVHPPRFDRFATHRYLVEQLPALAEQTGSCAAGLALLVAWDLADGRTGLVRCLTATRLAKMLGVTRPTAIAALAELLASGLLVVREPGTKNGRRAPVYFLAHMEKEPAK